MRPNIIRFRGLSFPGRKGGFDPNHVAANKTIVSAITTGTNNYINLINGVKGANNPNPPNGGVKIKAIIGPTCNFDNLSGTQDISFTPIPAPVAPYPATLAGIFILTALHNNLQILVQNGTACQIQFGIINNAITLNRWNASNDVVPSFTPATGVPYFMACSTDNTAVTNFVWTRLDTGAIQSAVVTPASAVTTGTNIVDIGNGGGNAFDGFIAAAMVTQATMSLPAMLQWAADPWSFWYPETRIEAFSAPSAAAAPNFGWYKRTQDDRLLPVSRLPDQGAPFFRPSQIPVPTTWLPTTGQEDRPPPPWRRPDDSSIESPLYFRPSQIPVPTRWLPTTGEEDRPPAQKRPPDEPTGYFFQKPGTVAPPSRWLPTTGEEDRPPHPNRIRSPDEPFPWFVRSPSPVPTTWLPTTGEEDRPPAQKRPPDEAIPFSRSPSSFQPILLPTTGQEDRPPPLRPDLTPGATPLKPPAPPAGIAGMAWWRSVEQFPTPPAPPPLDYHASWSPRFIVQVTRKAFDYVIRARRRGRR